MKLVKQTLIGCVLLMLTGCAHNAVVSDGVTRTGKYYGSFGITGDNCDVTVEEESKLSKLSFLGNGNRVTIEDGASCNRVEFWGRNNTVSAPYGLVMTVREVGEGNRIINRPRTPRMVDELYSPAQPLPEIQVLVTPAPPAEKASPSSEEAEQAVPAPIEADPGSASDAGAASAEEEPAETELEEEPYK